MSDVDDSLWELRALCGPKSQIPAQHWTANRKPPAAVRKPMERVCRRCPVKAQCAGNALDDGLESAMIAGVWVPLNTSQNEQVWADAIRQLKVIAGRDPDTDTNSGVETPRTDGVSVIELPTTRTYGSAVAAEFAAWTQDDDRLGAAG